MRMITYSLLAGTAFLFTGIAGTAPARARPNSPAIIQRVRVISVHDGDTCTVAVTTIAKVRLLDCWAPELKEEGGDESRMALEELVLDKDVLLEVPTTNQVGKSMSFGRVLGHLWLEDNTNSVSELLVERGFATKNRKDK